MARSLFSFPRSEMPFLPKGSSSRCLVVSTFSAKSSSSWPDDIPTREDLPGWSSCPKRDPWKMCAAMYLTQNGFVFSPYLWGGDLLLWKDSFPLKYRFLQQSQFCTEGDVLRGSPTPQKSAWILFWRGHSIVVIDFLSEGIFCSLFAASVSTFLSAVLSTGLLGLNSATSVNLD